MDRTALASVVAAVTMGPVAAWPAQLLPHVPCRNTQPRQPAATHAPTTPLTAEQLYVVAAALLADGGESFVHHHGPAQIAGSIQGPQRDAPHPWHATLRGRIRVWDAGAVHPLPGLSRGRHWCCRRQATRPSCTATPEGTGRTSWPGAAGLSGTAPPGKGHSRPCPMWTGSRGPPRPTICRRTPGRWQSCYTLSAPPTGGRNQDGSSPPHWCGAATRRSIYGLPEVGHAAARAALRYRVAQGWILDETARGSVNFQEAVDRVAHAGQAAVALHTRGCHGGPAEGIILEPSGMVLVLAADMVRGVLHTSHMRQARPQWTIQVYTPPRPWPSSTWAVLAVMWHLAPEDAPTGIREEIARDLPTWPASQDYPWRRRWGGLPVAPAAEGLSLAATL